MSFGWDTFLMIERCSYGDSVDNSVERNSSVLSLIQMHWLPSARACGQKNFAPNILNWRCRQMQVCCRGPGGRRQEISIDCWCSGRMKWMPCCQHRYSAEHRLVCALFWMPYLTVIYTCFLQLKHCRVTDPLDLCTVNVSGQNLSDAVSKDFEIFHNVVVINAADNLLPLG